MEDRPATLGIRVTVGADADAQEVAEATSHLRRELLELDVEAVEPARAGEPPPGARVVDLVALGTLVVTLAKSELLAAVVSAVRSWLGGQRERSVKLEVDGDVLELTGVSSGEQRRLSEEWLRRHARGERAVQAVEAAEVDPTRSALIVASYDYQDSGLRGLRAPAHDAEALARVLRDPKIGGFEVRTMLNEPAYVISEAVEEFFADRGRDDLLLLHFSCHGLKDEGGELYFAAANTKLRRLGATAVAADFVNRRMNRSRSQRVVLLLDCCYAGAFERGMTARAGTGVGIEEHFGGRGRAVITASSAMEYAFEGDQLADTQELMPSVFTSALVEGLETGEADRDQDGYVALDELYDYVYDRVREATPNQTPGKWTFAVQGDLYIARRSRPVTTPAPLPPELQQAVDHPLTQIRAGAVQELERLLQSRHAGLTLAAKLTLERLTEDDSRTVSAAAAAALGADVPSVTVPKPVPPRLGLSSTIIDFGRLSVHGQSPKLTVRLDNAGGGTLNARATTSASWLDLQQAGNELVLAVDTTEAGEHEGLVTVDSDGGSATIRVLARIEPKPLAAATKAPKAVAEMPSTQEAVAPEGSTARIPAKPPVAATTPTPTTPAGGIVEQAAARPTPPATSRADKAPRRIIGVGPNPGTSPVPPPAYAALPKTPAQDAGRTQGVADAERGTAATARDDRRLRVAGGMAIGGAALLVLSLFLVYDSYDSYYGGPLRLVHYLAGGLLKSAPWYALIMAALAFSAGICTLIPRTRRLIGPGILLGAAAAASLRMLTNPVEVLKARGSIGAGLWLDLAAHLVLVLAACLVGLTLTRAGGLRFLPQLPRDVLARLVIVFGIVGAAAFFYQFVHKLPLGRVPLIWGTAMALIVPASAAMAIPRRFGVALLAGWIGGAAALVVLYYFIIERLASPLDIGSAPIVVFGCTLLALLLVAIPFARAASTPQLERPTQGS